MIEQANFKWDCTRSVDWIVVWKQLLFHSTEEDHCKWVRPADEIQWNHVLYDTTIQSWCILTSSHCPLLYYYVPYPFHWNWMAVVLPTVSVLCWTIPQSTTVSSSNPESRSGYITLGITDIMSSRGCGLSNTLVTLRLVIGGNNYHDFIHGMRILYCDMRSCTKTVHN